MNHLIVTTLFLITGVFFIHAQNPSVSRSITPPLPADPEWSYGLPVYQIATRYYNETGGFKEIGKDIPRLRSLNVVINFSASQTTGTINDTLPKGNFTVAFTNVTANLSGEVDLPGRGYRVYVKDTPPRTSR